MSSSASGDDLSEDDEEDDFFFSDSEEDDDEDEGEDVVVEGEEGGGGKSKSLEAVLEAAQGTGLLPALWLSCIWLRAQPEVLSGTHLQMERGGGVNKINN